MKHNRIILFSVLLLTISTITQAQLLERENVKSRIAAGSRPEAGDFGFMIGASIEEIKEIFDDETDIQGFPPLLSFKYYLTDNIELRLNTQSYAKSKDIQGSIVNQVGLEDNVNKESFIRFLPSAQYHFANSNLLDTYGGFGIIIGSEKNEIMTTEKTTINGDYVALHLSKKTFVSGFNIDFGLQAFVADLPISIGIEASLRGVRHSNLQYENTFSSSVGGVVTNQTYLTIDKDSALKYSSLKYKTYEVGADLRFMLSYYFRR